MSTTTINLDVIYRKIGRFEIPFVSPQAVIVGISGNHSLVPKHLWTLTSEKEAVAWLEKNGWVCTYNSKNAQIWVKEDLKEKVMASMVFVLDETKRVKYINTYGVTYHTNVDKYRRLAKAKAIALAIKNGWTYTGDDDNDNPTFEA